ncbi:hypothetical protein [Sunxiuqinia indica]|uniref:hypothetical protein n=1 Tax=Sunxiuqinia indica TaxID=2692584 RepID=UPI001357EBBB|nr:hypothetical protein [Sunxiuqinia indica]
MANITKASRYQRHEKIIICPQCKGTETETLTDFDLSKAPDVKICRVCNGKGRLRRVITINDEKLNE